MHGPSAFGQGHWGFLFTQPTSQSRTCVVINDNADGGLTSLHGSPLMCRGGVTEISNHIVRFSIPFQWGRVLSEGPIILLDIADNCNSGGTLNSMALIREALDQGLEDILAGPICDPAAVAEMIDAGIGSQVTVAVGGKTDFAAIECFGEPVLLSGRVQTISEGRFVVRGPVFTGMQVDLGRTVVLDTGPMQIVVSEDRIDPLDLDMFRFVGIEPLDKRSIVLKSKIQYRPPLGSSRNRLSHATQSASVARIFHSSLTTR